jgi:hypothetical protein
MTSSTRHPRESRDPVLAAALRQVLMLAFRHSIDEPNIESAFERIQQTTTLDYDSFRDAIDVCLRDGLIRDPVRIEEGALQCHWKLELTPKGVQQARKQQ